MKASTLFIFVESGEQRMSFVSDFKKLTLVLAVSASSMLICNGCVTALVGATAAGAGAFIGSDSRTVDVQVDDQKIENQVARILKNDRMRSDSKVFRVDCVSVNGNVLLVGQTRDTEYMNWALGYIKKVPNVKRIFNCVSNKDPIKASVIAHDAFITSKVKSALLFGSKISSGRFKVYTEDSVVYLLGYITRDEGQRAINQTRKVGGIKKIHPIFDYMDASGTPNSSDSTPVVSDNSSNAQSLTVTPATTTRSSSSMANEVQSDVDNGGAVLEDDTDLLAPSAPAQSF